MERVRNRLQLSRDEQIRIFSKLTDAVAFEEFIRRKFVGAKSFSLEGCESLIPLLDLAIEKAAEQGAKEIVFGMAHRGRLNVLANIIGKSPRQIFREFADDPKLFRGHGDVKYHLGYSNEWTTVSGAKVHLSLCFNPSHLEFVNPRRHRARAGENGPLCLAAQPHAEKRRAARVQRLRLFADPWRRQLCGAGRRAGDAQHERLAGPIRSAARSMSLSIIRSASPPRPPKRAPPPIPPTWPRCCRFPFST